MLIFPSVFLGILLCFRMLLGSPLVTSGWLVGQEPAPSKCVFLSTSREVRKDMKEWVLSREEISGLSSLMFGI